MMEAPGLHVPKNIDNITDDIVCESYEIATAYLKSAFENIFLNTPEGATDSYTIGTWLFKIKVIEVQKHELTMIRQNCHHIRHQISSTRQSALLPLEIAKDHQKLQKRARVGREHWKSWLSMTRTVPIQRRTEMLRNVP
jgi:hypothetical protein